MRKQESNLENSSYDQGLDNKRSTKSQEKKASVKIFNSIKQRNLKEKKTLAVNKERSLGYWNPWTILRVKLIITKKGRTKIYSARKETSENHKRQDLENETQEEQIDGWWQLWMLCEWDELWRKKKVSR